MAEQAVTRARAVPGAPGAATGVRRVGAGAWRARAQRVLRHRGVPGQRLRCWGAGLATAARRRTSRAPLVVVGRVLCVASSSAACARGVAGRPSGRLEWQRRGPCVAV